MKELVKYEDQFEYQTTVSEVRITLNKIRSLLIIYGNKYVDAASVKDRITAIMSDPEVQQYLYACLIDEVTEAIKQIDTLDA